MVVIKTDIFLKDLRMFIGGYFYSLFHFIGNSLVCHPEFDYDTHWPLAVYGTNVNIPCPRNGKGKALHVSD